MLTTNYNSAIDLVYLWCDDADISWRQKRLKYQSQSGAIDFQAAHPSRFQSHDELKYSLRSVAKFAPWINHIFIISDNQTPSWLDTSNPKITMIKHDDILPKANLPVFNSMAIETALANIQGLSERFLYANDDMFFGSPCSPDFFFQNGKAIIRMKPAKKRKIKTSQYARHITAMQQLAAKAWGLKCHMFPHHNIDAYFRSDYQKAMEFFKELRDKTARQRFREEEALQRVIVDYYMLSHHHAIAKEVRDVDVWLPFLQKLKQMFLKEKHPDSFCTNINSFKGFDKLLNLRPPLFCLNDTEKVSGLKVDIPSFLASLFPDKCEFEK